VNWSCSIDAARKAARSREVDVEISDARVGEHPVDDGLQFAPIDHVGIDHRRVSVVGSEGQDPKAKQPWYFVWPNGSPLCVLANENRAGSAVRRIRVLVCERHEHDALAGCGIHEADPARKAGLTVRDVALRAPRSQLLIVKGEEWREGLKRQWNNLKVHRFL
jgi:hypothetical protein